MWNLDLESASRAWWRCAFVAVSLAPLCARAEECPAGSPRSWEYVVKQGDTLVGIAIREVGDARAVHAILCLNPSIEDPNRIRAEQVILLPEPEATAPDAPTSIDPAGIFSRLYWRLESLGIASLTLFGVAVVIVLALAFQVAAHLIAGGIVLWFCALLAGAPDAGLGRSHFVNLQATFFSALAAIALWAGAAVGFSFLPQEAVWSLPFERFVFGVFGIVSTVQLCQFLVYLGVVRTGFAISGVRAFGCCLLAFCFHVLFTLALTPALSGAAFGL